LAFTPEVWDGVLHRLQSEVPAFTYATWLQPLELRPEDKGVLLVCPSTFHRERIRRHFLPRIDACLKAELGGPVEIALAVDTRPRAASPAPSTAPPTGPSAATGASISTRRATPGAKRGGGRQAIRRSRPRASVATEPSALSTPGPSAIQYTFDSFVVGPCNALAREAAFAMAGGQQRTLNQLYLRADPGMGKTHLARAVATEAARLGNGAVRYVSSENFTNQFLSALRSNRTSDFKRRYRGKRGLFVMEDVQFLESKSATQLEFFHTVQHVLDAGGKVMLTGDRLPQDMRELGARIRSQLSSGFFAELEPPDHRVRRAILRSKAAHGAVRLPADCLDLLVESVRGSVRDLEGVLIQLVTTASLLKQPIDLALTQSAIAKKGSAAKRISRLGVGDVIAVVAGFFQSSPDGLASRSRRRQVLLPRQLAMYLCRRYTDASVGEIGQALGRDQPAVRNALRKIERGILEQPPLRYQAESLGERLDALVAALDRPSSAPPRPGEASA
jgi:chromosomal replication initiator protein